MGRNMKLWMLVVATLLCYTKVASASKIRSTAANDDDNFALNLEPLVFTIDDNTGPQDYVTFVDKLRDTVKSGERSYDIPILYQNSKVPPGSEYLRLELSYYGDSITMAVDVTNLNLVAYQAGTVSYFFRNYYQELKDKLFENAVKKVQIPFNVRYTELGGRDGVELGLSALKDSIKTLHGYNPTQMKTIKQGVVVVNQMFLEAARLQIVERQVTTDFDQGFIPVDDVFSYQDNWKELSRAIQAATEGKFKEPIELLTPSGSAKEVSQVSQVKDNMGILLAKGGSSGILHDRDQEKWLCGLSRKVLDSVM